MTKRSQRSIASKIRRACAVLDANGMRSGGTLFMPARTALVLARDERNNALIAYLEEVCSRPNNGVVFKDGTCREITEEDKI